MLVRQTLWGCEDWVLYLQAITFFFLTARHIEWNKKKWSHSFLKALLVSAQLKPPLSAPKSLMGDKVGSNGLRLALSQLWGSKKQNPKLWHGQHSRNKGPFCYLWSLGPREGRTKGLNLDFSHKIITIFGGNDLKIHNYYWALSLYFQRKAYSKTKSSIQGRHF